MIYSSIQTETVLRTSVVSTIEGTKIQLQDDVLSL